MSILPKWPAYEVGPPDSTFAIGVASIKYAQLEYTLGTIFQYVMDITHDETQRLFAKLRNVDLILSLLSARLNSMYLPDEARERLEAFISGYRTCAQNRNLLMHSNIHASVKTATTLFKTNNKGEMILCKLALGELRQVADDMHEYFAFGIALSSALTTLAGDWPSLHSRLEPFPWPSIPPAPTLLEYTSPTLASVLALDA
jgi:hypothetical protein